MNQSSIPMKIIISSGSFLALLALSGLVCMSNTVHTSDIEHYGADQQPVTSSVKDQTIIIDNKTGSQHNQPQAIADENLKIGRPAETAKSAPLAENGPASRPRSGRLYQQQASQPIESYAAAYAAANSADQSVVGGSGHHHQLQQSVGTVDHAASSQADPSGYASFGETTPAQTNPVHPTGQSSSLVSGASVARQLSNANDYSSHTGGGSYYANHHMSPSSNEASYTSDQLSSLAGYYPAGSSHHPHHHYQQQQHHHHYKSGQPPSLPYGYPTNAYERSPAMSASYYADRGAYQPAASSPFWSASSFGNSAGGGLMSSASHAISHWTNGFGVAEIICGLVALAIGAVILGAPFFLIYLALMGNFSGSGTLSLTNPTSASAVTGGPTQANGRRKRLAVFENMNMDEQASKHPDLAAAADSVVRQLSPLVDLRQVSRTFKHLIRSIEKYSPKTGDEPTNKRANKQEKSSLQ